MRASAIPKMFTSDPDFQPWPRLTRDRGQMGRVDEKGLGKEAEGRGRGGVEREGKKGEVGRRGTFTIPFAEIRDPSLQFKAGCRDSKILPES